MDGVGRVWYFFGFGKYVNIKNSKDRRKINKDGEKIEINDLNENIIMLKEKYNISNCWRCCSFLVRCGERGGMLDKFWIFSWFDFCSGVGEVILKWF